MTRYKLLISFLLVCSCYLPAQQYDLSGMHGLRDTKGDIFLEAGGYDIFVTHKQGQVSNKGFIQAIKKLYGLENNLVAEYSSEGLGADNLVIEVQYDWGGNGVVLTDYIACYVLGLSDKEAAVLLFQSVNQQHEELEETIVKEYLKNRLADYISDDWMPSTFFFAGRRVVLDRGRYEFTAPHTIEGEGMRITWTEYQTMEEAEKDINTRMDATLADGMQIEKEEDIRVVFEDVPTLAYRIAFKERGSGNPLIGYYIAEKVRDRYISCVLSNYAADADDYRLDPMIRKLMSIPAAPDGSDAVPYYLETPERVEYNQPRFSWEVQGGAWIPAGNLSASFGISPSLACYIGYLFNERSSLDLGMQVAIPISRKVFEFKAGNYWYETKGVSAVGFNMRYQHRFRIASDTKLALYAGPGVNIITTDLEKGYDPEYDQPEYYSLPSLDLSGGVSIRYKRLGGFLEYHFVPYTMSNRVPDSFGNSAINIGLTYGI